MRRIVFLLSVVLIGALPNAAADGMLDPSFGNGGLVTTAFPFPFSSDYASAVIVLPDGRAVAAGGVGDLDGHAMGAARYLTSGALDTTFSSDGRATVAGCSSIGAGGGASAALLQPDGRLVLVGECPGGLSLSVARLNENGALDLSFGSNGQVKTSFPGGVFAAAAMLQPDGRIVAVGNAVGCCTTTAIQAARYNPDGSLDPSFGTGGKLTLQLAQDFVVADAVLQGDGKLVIAGIFDGGTLDDFGIVRLLPNGALDPSFDGDGVVISDFGSDEAIGSVIVLGDGRIVLGGRRLNDFALVRYLPDGSLDGTFGNGGLATADSGASETIGQLIALPNGKLLAAGSTFTAQDGPIDFLLARFHADGVLDTSFGSSGFLKTDFNSGSKDGCGAVAVAGPDLVLAAGTTFGAADFGDFALARYIASTPVELLTFEVE